MSEGPVNIGELLMHHTADAYALDFSPLFHWEWGKVLPDVHVAGITFNLTPTKHVFFLLVAATLVFLTMWMTGRSLQRQRAGERAPRGLASAMESLVLFVRDDIAVANIGHRGAAFAPYIMTLFFFVLYGNLLGLLPWGATPTGNLAVTARLPVGVAPHGSRPSRFP